MRGKATVTQDRADTRGEGFIIDSGNCISEKEINEDYQASYNTFDSTHQGRKLIRSLKQFEEGDFATGKTWYRKIMRVFYFENTDNEWIDYSDKCEEYERQVQPFGIA